MAMHYRDARILRIGGGTDEVQLEILAKRMGLCDAGRRLVVDQRVALRQEARRREVLAAAVAVFSERGYRAASMNDIAAKLGMGKASLYHYVASKEEVLIELYEDVLRENVIVGPPDRRVRAHARSTPSPS